MQTPPAVLVIDDDSSMRLTLAVLLEDEGYRVLSAADGEEGLAMLRASPVALVVVDMKMPGLSGDEVCAAVKAIQPAAAVIMITAHVAADVADRAMVAGAHTMLYKPLDIDALLDSIAQLIQEAQGAPSPNSIPRGA
ncbi:MAG: response regulator [Armatimonadota bacterium]|jgi:DNA-binding NtrC family response regulator